MGPQVAELKSWTDRQKLLQLELHLVGRAEQTYELLPSESHDTFTKAVEFFGKRLHPVQNETLLLAQLMKQKQIADETVDSYSQDFESLFEKSYGKRLGMDVASREFLKRDLFVQGLLIKWQEKVKFTIRKFFYALHQARAAGEYLLEIHDTTAPKKPYYKKRIDEESRKTQPQGGKKGTPPDGSARNKSREPGTCYKCGSQNHLYRECPQQKPPPETTNRKVL